MAFTETEKRIINTLYAAQRPLTTSQVSDKTNLAWITTMKYLKKLHKDRYLCAGKKSNAICWWLKTN